MAEVDQTRYEDLCRLCAAKTTLVLGINIFEEQGSMRQLDRKILNCLPIQMHEADELPKMICEDCVYKIESYYEFRERTLSTQRYLIDLLKEIHQSQHQQQNIVVPLDQTDLIMVQNDDQLLNVHSIENVTELNLSQLIKHEIILSQQNVDISAHSLDNIALSHHELTSQDLSNHSLQPQEQILVETTTSHSLPGNHFTEDNLDLIHQQHQLLSGHFRLQPDLHVSISEADSVVNEITLAAECNEINQITDDNNSTDKKYAYQDASNSDENSLTADVKLNEVQTHSYQHISDEVKCYKNDDSNNERLLIDAVDSIKHDDSNSDHLLLIDEQIHSNTNKRVLDVQEKEDKEIPVTNSNGQDQTNWFYCNLCGQTYEKKQDFDRHYLTHFSKLCNLCGQTYEKKQEFDRHYQTHFFKCSICKAMFTNSETLHLHRKEVHGISDNQKDDGTKVESNNNSRYSSDSEVEADNIDTSKDYETENEQGNESLDNKKKKWSPKVCKECGKSYKTNYKLTEHMRKHTGEKPYKCSSCEKAFRSKIGLAQHEAKHTGQYDYSCTTCGKGFQCKSYLMVHQRVHSDLKPYPCTTCGRNFKTKQSLLDHTNRHLGVKPYMCDTCGRGFITKGLCKAHQKVHTGQDNRKYLCKICNKRFVSKSYLQTHLRIHTGEKPFMCEVCGKGFLTRVDLRIHSTMHTGEKAFICEICGKAFARRDALRCHRRSHTGERPYSCDLCGQTFTQFTPMAIHKRLHTGERPYTCETCGKTFISRSTMVAHAKKHNR